MKRKKGFCTVKKDTVQNPSKGGGQHTVLFFAVTLTATIVTIALTIAALI